jgi:PAS domain S-box-containing protein
VKEFPPAFPVMTTQSSPRASPMSATPPARREPEAPAASAAPPRVSPPRPGPEELAARFELTDSFADLGSWSWDPIRDVLTVTDRLTRLLGMVPGEPMTIEDALRAMPDEDARRVRGLLAAIVSDGLDTCSVDYRFCAPDGTVRWLEGYCLAVRDGHGAVEKILGLSRDVTQRVEAVEEALRSQRELESARDYLRAVTDTMDEAMFTLDPDGRARYINPAAERVLGWSAGELDGRLMHAVTHSQHPDGSPFPIEDCPIMLARAGGRTVHVTEDVFICRDGRQLPVSYTALPFSTDAGVEGCVVIFEDITERKAEERRIACDREKLAWAGRIRRALAEDRFELHSQPIVDCASGRTVQRELLLRLRDPERGLVMPAEFLPVAEELGLITEIDRWVIGRAAEIAANSGAVEVNISARSIGDLELVDQIEQAIGRTGVDPALLVFEITETALIGDEPGARSFLERLHRLGCRIALDDFGTGYGSFTYLKRLPIDILKIDIEFVRDLREDPASRRVVEAVVGLAGGFGLKTIAEGVEDEATFRLLVELGVDQAQGFHLGRPRPLGASDAAALSHRARPPRSSPPAGAPADRRRAASLIARVEAAERQGAAADASR